MAGIGDYKPIQLVRYTITFNQSGDPTQQAQYWNAWAEVTDNGGGRSQAEGRTTLGTSRTFKIWFRENTILIGEWKILYFGDTYAITHIERINEKRFNLLVFANVQS
jgi:hypothetical protein